MGNRYEPLDFEFEEFVKIAAHPIKKKKKIIGFDDLLKDYERDQKKISDREARSRKIRKICDSDDDLDDLSTEDKLSVCVDKCQKEISKIDGDDEMPSWGIQVFGEQKKMPYQEYAELKNSSLLKHFMNQETPSLFELNIENGENFLEGLLTNGWILQLIYACGRVEKSIATWTFNLMLYSSKLEVMEAACIFWCNILSHKDKEDGSSSFKIDWLPSFSDLKRGLEIYGYHLDSLSRSSSDIDMVDAEFDTRGPPENIVSWVKFAAICCRRDTKSILLYEEAEEMLYIIISLFLDRKLIGLSMVLSDCMLSVISFFTEDEWNVTCEKVAKYLACRLPRDINCLRLVESVTGVDARSKQFRSAVAFQFVVACLNDKIHDGEEVLRHLGSISVKHKNCDLLKMYIYLSLAENWLSFDPATKDKITLHELWGACLRNCSTGITITDLRPFASHVRCKASYLLQVALSK